MTLLDRGRRRVEAAVSDRARQQPLPEAALQGERRYLYDPHIRPTRTKTIARRPRAGASHGAGRECGRGLSGRFRARRGNTQFPYGRKAMRTSCSGYFLRASVARSTKYLFRSVKNMSMTVR